MHFPLSENFPNALVAHQAAEAAGQQGSDYFWAMHDKLFEERETWVAPVEEPFEQIKVLAEELGLDLAQFEADFASAATLETIKADEQYLESEYDLQATPSLILGNENLNINVDWTNVDEALELVREKTRGWS